MLDAAVGWVTMKKDDIALRCNTRSMEMLFCIEFTEPKKVL